MSTRTRSLFQAVLARLSLGAVPIDGMHWFDPRESAPRARKRHEVPDAEWSPVSLSLSAPRARRWPL